MFVSLITDILVLFVDCKCVKSLSGNAQNVKKNLIRGNIAKNAFYAWLRRKSWCIDTIKMQQSVMERHLAN